MRESSFPYSARLLPVYSCRCRWPLLLTISEELEFWFIFISNILLNVNLNLLNRCNQLIRISKSQIASRTAWNTDEFDFYRFSINNHFSNIIISLFMQPIRVYVIPCRIRCSVFLHFKDIDVVSSKEESKPLTLLWNRLKDIFHHIPNCIGLTVSADFFQLIVDAGRLAVNTYTNATAIRLRCCLWSSLVSVVTECWLDCVENEAQTNRKSNLLWMKIYCRLHTLSH